MGHGRMLAAALAVLAVAACYRIYDGLDDQWNVIYAMVPEAGGSCAPTLASGTLELLRHRTAGLRGSLGHDSVVCTTSAGTVTIPASTDTLVGGQVFDQEPDSLYFTLSGLGWVWSGTQVERHLLQGTNRVTLNDSIVITGNWQAERR